MSTAPHVTFPAADRPRLAKAGRGAFLWIAAATAVSAAIYLYHLLTCVSMTTSAAFILAGLACALGGLASDRNATGARTRFYGSGAVVAGSVVGVAAVLCGGSASVAWSCAVFAAAGMAAIVGDALSGARPLREAVERVAGTLASVAGFLALPVIGWALGT